MRKFHLLVASLVAVSGALSASAACAAEAGAGRPAEADKAAPATRSFSTGVAKGRDLLDSAISASTIDAADILKLGISSSVGIIGNLPGIRVENTGIDGISSVTVRGLPLSSDGMKYLQLQEDGLPVTEFGDIHFATSDAFVRTDLSLSQIQAIRGGSASTFTSNAPGGVVNMISKTGEHEGGAVQLSAGLDHDLNRIDFSYGGPINKDWRFHVGGFYHQGEGTRAIGYDAVQGGQIKFNITRQFANGYVRLLGKLLDDRQPNYGVYPVMISGSDANPVVTSLPNTDVRHDAVNSQYVSTLLGVDQANNPRTINMREGVRSISKSLGLEAQFDVAGWTISEKFRYSKNSGAYNDSFSVFTLPAAVVAPMLGGPGASFSYATGPLTGQTVTNPSAIGGNGMVDANFRIHADLDDIGFVVNDLRASRVWDVNGGKLTTTAGVYGSSQTLKLYLNFATTLESLAGNGQSALLNLSTAGGTALSQGGVIAYGLGLGVPVGSYHYLYDVNYRVLAPYGSANYQIGRWAIGASVRFDNGKATGLLYGSDLGGGRVASAPLDVDRNGTISATESSVALLPLTQPGNVNYRFNYVSYSTGVNYRISKTTSAFARYSRGARAAADRLLFSASHNPTTGQLSDPGLAQGAVKQAEVGFKLRKSNYEFYATGFWASTDERNLQIGADSSGNAVVLQLNRTYTAKGLELEGSFRHGPFSVAAGATYVKAKISKDVSTPANVGRTPRHQPELFFQLRPQYENTLVTLGATVNGTTSSFAQDTGGLKMPGYVLVSPFLAVRPMPRVELGLQVYNVFDKLALLQLGASTIPASGIVNAQALNGRMVKASLRFNF